MKGNFNWQSQCAHCDVIAGPKILIWLPTIVRTAEPYKKNMVAQHLIPLRALILYLDPSYRTYVCPYLMRRMRYSFSVNSRTERKCMPDNARTGTKVTKTGHFGKLRKWGFKKNAHTEIKMRKQIVCAYSL